MANQQALKFVMVDFSGDNTWTRKILADAVMEYTSAGGTVQVVRESATGVFTTYKYALKPQDTVQLIGQVIYLPRGCQGKAAGDNIGCGSGKEG